MPRLDRTDYHEVAAREVPVCEWCGDEEVSEFGQPCASCLHCHECGTEMQNLDSKFCPACRYGADHYDTVEEARHER